MRLLSQTSIKYRNRRTGYLAQSEQHELSKVGQKNASSTGAVDSMNSRQPEFHNENRAPSTRSEENVLPFAQQHF